LSNAAASVIYGDRGKSDIIVIIGLAFQNDSVGNRTGLREASGRLTPWTYDDSYQLVNEHRTAAGDAGYNVTYIYDPASNRVVENAAGSLTTSTYDAANQTQTQVSSTGTTTYSFDAAGNEQIVQAPSGITTNVWDYENQTTLTVKPNSQRVTMLYDADLLRVRKET
jgi:YD repeat-containing protein